MNERDDASAGDMVKFGLLMESAQAHQKLAESVLGKLVAHTQGLDEVVRDEIRRTLVEEFRALRGGADLVPRPSPARQRSRIRSAAWNLGFALLWAVVPAAIAHFAWPSKAEIAALRAQRDAIADNLAQLQRQGGKVDWRHCGPAARLCVRTDRAAPAFGPRGEYSIVAGY